MLHGARFSAEELDALRALLAGRPNPLEGRRKAEFEQKLHTGAEE
jgi:hypothetical protein